MATSYTKENVKELQRFLGLVDFYSHFILQFAEKGTSLCLLLHKWTEVEERAMRGLSKAFRKPLTVPRSE